MRKRGMIGEKYRLDSEEKWNKVLLALDAGEDWDGFTQNLGEIRAGGRCGYCHDVKNRVKQKGATEPFFSCSKCYMINHICNCDSGNRKSLFHKFLKAMDTGDRQLAREYAVRIRDYIRDDKPKEKVHDIDCKCEKCNTYNELKTKYV
jgi:hypothetical protein